MALIWLRSKLDSRTSRLKSALQGAWSWTVLLALLVGCRELPAQKPYNGTIGINLAGAEFGTHRPEFSSGNPGLHGRDYIFPTEPCLSYFSQRGFRLVRLPLSWERLQPAPLEQLDPVYMRRVQDFLDMAWRNGCQVVLDLHNYGSYRQGESGRVRDLLLEVSPRKPGGLGAAALADVWLRVGRRVMNHPALHAYGLMNEPHDMVAAGWMGGGGWHEISRRVVAAIRASGDSTWLWVGGDGWSKASEWSQHNPPAPWVADSLGRVVYEAHIYFDSDASGRYRMSYESERQADPRILDRAEDNLRPFAEWCSRNGVVGVIGEFGVPWHDRDWRPLFDRFLEEVEERGMTACAWAGGDMWGDYILSLHLGPGSGGAPGQALFRQVGLRARSAIPSVGHPTGLR